MNITKYKNEIEDEINRLGYEAIRYDLFSIYGPREWSICMDMNDSGDGFFVYATMDHASVMGKRECPDFQSAKRVFFEKIGKLIRINQSAVLKGEQPYYKCPLWSMEVLDLHTGSIDAMGVVDDHLELLIVDEMCWALRVEESNLLQLQEKINNYIHFLETKQYVEKYGDHFSQKVITINCRYLPSDNGIAFFEHVQKALSQTDIRLKLVLPESE